MTTPEQTRPFDFEIRLILRVAMALFIYTVAIGIINGLDLVDFERKPLLAHLHIGTLGWITMAVFALSLWLFGDSGSQDRRVEADTVLRWTARLAPAVAALYGVAFFTTYGIARPLAGSLMGVVILLIAGWGFSRARGRSLSVVHLGVLAGLASSVIGAVLGVLNGLLVAQPDLGLADTIADAHPAAMVVGFLVPVGMAFIEFVARPGAVEEPAGRLGQAQIGAPFLGGLVLLVALLLEIEALAPLSLLLEVVGIVIFLRRLGSGLLAVSLTADDHARHGAMGAIFLVVNIALLVYVISNYIDDFDAAPRRLVLALDHSIFIGVLTNSILALIATAAISTRPSWVDHAVFWGVNVGVAGFIVGLISDADLVLNVFTPLLGFAILLAIAAHFIGAPELVRSTPRAGAADAG
jgi:hypothetical protein